MADKNVLIEKYGAMAAVARNLDSDLEYKALARIVLALMTSRPADHIKDAKRATLDEWLSNQENANYFFAIQHFNNALEDLKEE